MTTKEFATMCNRHVIGLRPLPFIVRDHSALTIPASPEAVHCGVAGKIPQLIYVSRSNHYAFVLTTDGRFIHAPTSKIVPVALMPSSEQPGSQQPGNQRPGSSQAA